MSVFFFFEICEVSCLATNYQCLYVKVVPLGEGAAGGSSWPH
jgi:hypothetical protein